MTAPRPAPDRLTYQMPAIEEEFCSPEGMEALRAGLVPWTDAKSGDFVGIRRELHYTKERDIISPQFGVLVRQGKRVMEVAFPTIARARRLPLSDAVVMSAFGATSTFLHDKIRRVSADTLPRIYDFEMIYLHGALIVQAALPIIYWSEHVRFIQVLPHRKAAVAGYGTIVMPPRPDSNHAEMARRMALREAYDFYRARMGKNELENEDIILDPRCPTGIEAQS